jgi:hypothetical protein
MSPLGVIPYSCHQVFTQDPGAEAPAITVNGLRQSERPELSPQPLSAEDAGEDPDTP